MNSVYANPEYATKVAELKQELKRLRKQYDVPDTKTAGGTGAVKSSMGSMKR